MPRKNRNRHIRRNDPKGMVLKARDLEVIEAVHRFRVLSQAQIQTLFFGSKATAQYRLERLYDNAYVDRKFFPSSPREGRSPTLYILDRKGAEALRVEKGYQQIRFYASSKDRMTQTLAHTYAINQVMTHVALACHKYGFQLESWQTENEVKADYDRVMITKAVKRETVPVLPDSVFTVIALKRRHRFLLELDRGTMETARFKAKVKAYNAYHESGGFEKRYNSTAMRVLTVVSTRFSGEKRLMNLKRATEEAGGKARYWFTTLQATTPETVLSASIWYVAGESEPTPLIEIK
jgi:hypothetical protein